MPKAPKGTVSVASQAGMLRLRWRVNGQPYSLPLGLAAGTVTIQAPKTDHEYILDLQPNVIAMLLARQPAKPTDLVFPTPGGKQINAHNFRSRCWVTTIAAAGIPYRPPYFTRHSTGSHLIDQGATYPQVAYALGHKSTRMVVQTYGRMLDRPKMPEF